MSESVSLTVEATLNWLYNTGLDLTTVSDSCKLKWSNTWSDGSGDDGTVQTLWHDSRTISGAAGTGETLDLEALSQTMYGTALSFDLGACKMLLIYNTNTTAADDLYIDASVSNAFVGQFNDVTTSKIEIPADGCVLFTNQKGTWTVDGTHSDLRIVKDTANDVTYEIVLAR